MHLTRRCEMRDFISTFIRDESDATAIESGLIATGIEVAFSAAAFATGTSLN
jgi:Flp pilus assembly pilin Flp